MKTLNEYVAEYKKQLAEGDILEAYRGLMSFMMQLRIYLKNNYPDYTVSGSLYQGYMDMSYLAFTPDALKSRKLKIAILLNHEQICFEVWLCGFNKQIQKKYWSFFSKKNWNKYTMPSDIKGTESIIEKVLVEQPNFNDLDALTKQIEKGTLEFIEAITNFLEQNP